MKQLIKRLKYRMRSSVGVVSVTQTELTRVIEAAELLCEIHKMADDGELDGVDIGWMVRADSLCVSDEDETE
jgi:hypothetical protein